MAGLSDVQLAGLESRGLVRVQAAITATEAGQMEDRVWRWLAERNGVDRDDDAGRSSDVRRMLARTSPWFAAPSEPGGDRIKRFMGDGDTVDGVDVRVVELTGAPGDLVVMHPWVMHNISMNVADTPE